MPGIRVAFTTAVEVRSYSPMSGDTWADSEIHSPSQVASIASATACSWAPFA